MRTIILFVLAAVAAFGQAQTPLTVNQNSGSATGALRLQERRTFGTDYVGIAAPDNVPASITWRLPGTDGTGGHCINTDGSGQLGWGECKDRTVSDYDWTQTIGARSGSGDITLTFTGTSCPAAGTDALYVIRVYESATPATYELATSTGAGTCVRGGAGTIIVTGPTATYTNAIAASASAGFQEAILSVADSVHVRIRAKVGSYHVYSSIYDEDRAVAIACDSIGATLVPRINGLKVINSTSPTGIRVSNCHFSNVYSTTGNTAIYAENPDGSNYGAVIEGNWFSSFDKSIHAATISGWKITGNQFLNSTSATAAIHTENLDNGDQGVGLISGNIFTCGATCTYGLLWNGPGALQLKLNNFNGYTTQVHLQPRFGTATSSGSTVTWATGNKFRTTWVGQTIYIGSTGRTIASVDSDTQITTSTSIGTLSGDYYVNASSQVSVMSNNFDAGPNTQYGVRWTGGAIFQNAQIEGNFYSNWFAVNNHEAISIDSNTQVNFLGIRNNNIQSAGGTATFGIRVRSGYGVSVINNQVAGSQTAVAIGNSQSAKVAANECILAGTACLTSTNSNAEIFESQSVTYAELSALSAANGSRVFCSNCSAVCATSGTGSIASRVNGAWACADGTGSKWTVSGSDVYRPSGNVAIGDVPNTSTLLVKGASGADGVLELKHGTATSSFQLYASNTFSALGTYTSSPLIFATDSAGRWRITAAGMFHPEANDAYDIGLTGTRVRGVYAGFGEFWKSGGTYSSDYLSSRKLNILDLAGGSGAWDMYAAGSMVANSQWTMRDNAGSRALQITRAVSGSPVRNISAFGNLNPAKRLIADGDAVDDATFGDFGSNSARWLTGYLGTTDTNTLVVNNTVSSTLNPTTTNTHSLGDPSLRWANVRGVASDFTGTTTLGEIRSQTASAHTIGQTGNRFLRLFVDGITTAGSTFFQTGAALTIATGTTLTMDSCTTIGHVLTAGASGVLTCQAAGGVSAPLTLTLSPSGYSQPLTLSNSTVGLNGSCLGLNGHDGASTIYTVSRLCAKFTSALFTDEIAELQTATGSGTFATAQSWKNLESTFYGALLPSGTVALGANGNDFNRLWVGGVETSSFSRPQTDLGATNGSLTKRWSSTFTNDGYVTSKLILNSTGTVDGAFQLQITNSAATMAFIAGSGGGSTGGGGIQYFSTVTPTASGDRLGFNIYGARVASTSYNRAAVTAFATQAWTLGAAEGARLCFESTPNSSTTRAVQWCVEQNGALVPETNNAVDIATSAKRAKDLYLSGTADISGNLSAAVINSTGSPAYRVGGTTVIDSSRNLSNIGTGGFSGLITATAGMSLSGGTFTLNSTVTGDVIPTTSNTYVNGSSSSYWNQIAGATMFVEGGSIRPRTGGVGTVGISSARFAKGWLTDLDITGTITAPSGATYSGTTSCGAGQAVKTIVVSQGLVTSVTCGTP
jgi:hypothetical protein